MDFEPRPHAEPGALSVCLLSQFSCRGDYHRSESHLCRLLGTRINPLCTNESRTRLHIVQKTEQLVRKLSYTFTYIECYCTNVLTTVYTLRWTRMGIMKAAVFPEPVGAHASTSRPWMCACACVCVVCVWGVQSYTQYSNTNSNQTLKYPIETYRAISATDEQKSNNALHGIYLLCLSL